MHKLARISYNSGEWKRPTGDARKYESPETYNARNGFGHEDWLFRSEWTIDGWRYAFIQGMNKPRRKYLGQPLNVTLFTIQPDNRRRCIASIYGLEALDDHQARAALDVFKERGWLRIMQSEVEEIRGNADALGAPEWAEHVLNVRFRAENVDPSPADSFFDRDDPWILARHRYMLYDFTPEERSRLEDFFILRRGATDDPSVKSIFRRGTKPVEVTPEHAMMQKTLLAQLRKEYLTGTIVREENNVDVIVTTPTERIFFEIKSDLEPREVIRQALGQLLEYAYHPLRRSEPASRLVIVGRCALRPLDQQYLDLLRSRFSLPLEYRVVSV